MDLHLSSCSSIRHFFDGSSCMGCNSLIPSTWCPIPPAMMSTATALYLATCTFRLLEYLDACLFVPLDGVFVANHLDVLVYTHGPSGLPLVMNEVEVQLSIQSVTESSSSRLTCYSLSRNNNFSCLEGRSSRASMRCLWLD